MEQWKAIDALLVQAFGPDLGRLIAGSYRLAEAAVTVGQQAMAAEQAQQRPKEDDPPEPAA